MPALITELIDKFDTSEIVCDQIAAIVKLESEAQEALALAATPTPKDPRLWRLRVFTERSNPWDMFGDTVTEQLDAIPIVNVSFETESFNASASNLFERQQATGSFNIDCYGYGVSTETDSGHNPGDAVAAKEAQRAARLVRNILMSAHYTYLGMPRGAQQLVSKRWPQSITVFSPPLGDRATERIVGARLALQVEFNEFAPQIQTETLETIFAAVRRAETGEIYFTARYGE